MDNMPHVKYWLYPSPGRVLVSIVILINFRALSFIVTGHTLFDTPTHIRTSTLSDTKTDTFLNTGDHLATYGTFTAIAHY